LYGIASGTHVLSLVSTPESTGNHEDGTLESFFEQLKIHPEETQPDPYSRSFWTVLAFRLADRNDHSMVLPKIVALSEYSMHHYPATVQMIKSSFDVDERTMDQVRQVSALAYEVALIGTLQKVALAIAGISCDASGIAPDLLLQNYAETQLETQSHRAMITTAAVLRTILHDTRYITDPPIPQQQQQALADLPFYHGAVTEIIEQVTKRLEIEINFKTPSSSGGSTTNKDSTVLDFCRKQIAECVTLQIHKSRMRQGEVIHNNNDMETTTSQENLKQLVEIWETHLLREAQAALQIVQTVTAKTITTQTSATTTPNNPNVGAAATKQSPNDVDLEGLTEAQRAKVLKKRAEKEAKAAAKRQAKEMKEAAVFGIGTAPIGQILQSCMNKINQNNPNNNKNNSTSFDWMAANIEITDILNRFSASSGVQRKPKIPKGTRDYLPEQMMIRQQAFSIIRRVFQAHGAVEIDTPVFELKDTLTGKYGEDSKLIYDLADQGGELLALRYDLTVPFARFLALNSVGNIKRFHIGKVYRRDQPALKRGRYREFYQCDFDIAGVYGRMVPDSECVCVACDILDALPIGNFGIKLNHRRLLDAILEICGVPADKFRTICSAVDKLDKEPWSEVKREMVDDKGLSEESADKIGEFVLLKGPPLELYSQLMETKRFGDHQGALEAMEDLRILFEYLEAFDKLKFISFDLSLARGLDYYTGVIYEAVCLNGNTQVGSIGGGGRYDNLVSMFQEAGKQTPCVGVSVGIERVFTLMEERLREEKGGSIKQPNVNVLIASAGGGMMKEKMKIARMLWDAKISAEFSQQEHVKLKKEIVSALDREVPFMVIVGENELAENKCKVKDMKAETEELVPMTDLVTVLRSKGVIPVGCEFASELLEQEKSWTN
jgi:histidyl-tRNA synthetase